MAASTQRRRGSWCCSFAVPPPSPENPKTLIKPHHHKGLDLLANPTPNSPQASKSGLNFVGRIDPRRILSPGRVSPIDSEIVLDPSPPAADPAPKCRGRNVGCPPPSPGPGSNAFDVRLNLRGKKGGGLVLEMRSEFLIAKSEVFAGLIGEYQKGLGCSRNNFNRDGDSWKMCRIEVPDVENLGVFKETIELMFEDDIPKKLLKLGPCRAIDILEVSAGIMFAKGVQSCLKYLEAVPWTEEEEEKLRSLFTVFKFDETTTQNILARLDFQNSADLQQNLARRLVSSITTCSDVNARNEMKSLVKGLLCKSSVYEKDKIDLNKEDLYNFCKSCLGSLVSLLEEAVDVAPQGRGLTRDKDKPLIERISIQVDNINWLVEILLDQQIGEEFVDMWADQGELLKMHGSASPMVRYELSRVSATLFIAMEARKLHCHADARARLLQAWFGPMLLDFGWLQRCKKGLDVKAVEEALGQTLLTLPLKQQYILFMEWFRFFSKHGSECPNLSKAFQIWWRRAFLRGSESNAIESR